MFFLRAPTAVDNSAFICHPSKRRCGERAKGTRLIIMKSLYALHKTTVLNISAGRVRPDKRSITRVPTRGAKPDDCCSVGGTSHPILKNQIIALKGSFVYFSRPFSAQILLVLRSHGSIMLTNSLESIQNAFLGGFFFSTSNF